MKDSWEMFLGSLGDEAESLARVHAAALALTQALVDGTPAVICEAERGLESARVAFTSASSRRRGMQIRGFGQLGLREVCSYAPRRLTNMFYQRISELTTHSLGLTITSNNNKALIAAGLERLVSITGAMQKAANDGAGTYKRRGFVPPPSNSVLVSSRA